MIFFGVWVLVLDLGQGRIVEDVVCNYINP
jgi:hypothetical protein